MNFTEPPEERRFRSGPLSAAEAEVFAAAVITAYTEDGKSIRVIARDTGRSYGAVQRVLAGARSVRAPRRPPSADEAAAFAATVITAYTEDGKSIRVIAKDTGHTYRDVHDVLDRAGVVRRQLLSPAEAKVFTTTVITNYAEHGWSIHAIAKDTGRSSRTVHRVLSDAGVLRRRRRRRLSGDEAKVFAATVITAYSKGRKSMRAIARDTGRTYNEVRLVLVDANLVRRLRPFADEAKVFAAKVITAYTQDGATIRVTAARTGRPLSAVHRVLVRAGIPRRPRQGTRKPG
ncbi:helix-turn-helix domain-containing protein [Streptomyces yaizuensis]|uniref:Helix-turn-helix domain-containing protein n=1 Tax=Streptomyces yaizuensis TaxID=2989713 RepID=A0ABQ5P6B6_9ACTN|nr:helix-turn-helix domain-containing protein [Streptomyces sp. YSPA8]GLF98114.1 hypothetical protein SYYSPA8_27475 [Streptomyces sp. YSPA8]